MNELNTFANNVPCASPNHAPRTSKITAIILHDTAGTAEASMWWFRDPKNLAKSSCHVLISKQGDIYRIVPDNLVAYHAGYSRLHHEEHVNTFSLGVEIELLANNDPNPYPAPQMDALIAWVAEAVEKYEIPLNRIVSHADIAIPKGRKVDPRGFDFFQFLFAVAEKL